MSKAKADYKKNHWGHSHTQVIQTHTPDLDVHLKKSQPLSLSQPEITEWGRMYGFGYEGPGKREIHINFDPDDVERNYLAYDPHHPFQRLYYILTPDMKNELKKELWKKSSASPKLMKTIAKKRKGRHATSDYPPLKVKVLGEMTYLDYFTDKKDDGLSVYRHTLGEESGIRPVITVDSKGRLWVVGGDYYSTEAGIIN